MLSIPCFSFQMHVLQGDSAVLQALQRQSMETRQLTLAVRQLQASQAVFGTELLQTSTVVRRLQQQGTQSAVMLTSVVCQGLGSRSLALPSATTAVPAVPSRAAKVLLEDVGRLPTQRSKSSTGSRQKLLRLETAAQLPSSLDGSIGRASTSRWIVRLYPCATSSEMHASSSTINLANLADVHKLVPGCAI